MRIPVSHGYLEALVKDPEGPPRGAAVVCHPHPLHGGTMHTKAVYRAAQGMTDAGLLALRFNFRGVGTSTGSYDDGVGERDDLRDVLAWMERKTPHLPIVAGGFSFGSMVGLSVGAEDDRVVSLLGLGLPVDLERYDYDFLRKAEKPTLIVQGENDEFGSGDKVADLVAGLGSHLALVRVPDTDHYFEGQTDVLREAVAGYYASGPGSRTLLSF